MAMLGDKMKRMCGLPSTGAHGSIADPSSSSSTSKRAERKKEYMKAEEEPSTYVHSGDGISHDMICASLEPGMCERTTTLASKDALTVANRCYRPRVYKEDLLSTDRKNIEEHNKGFTMTAASFVEGMQIKHPCPVNKLYRPTIRGPVRVLFSLPTHSKHQSSTTNDTTTYHLGATHGEKRMEQYKAHKTWSNMLQIPANFAHTNKAEDDFEYCAKVDLKETLQALSHHEGISHIIPLAIVARVLQAKNIPPMELIIAANPTIPFTDKVGKSVLEDAGQPGFKMEWSSATAIKPVRADTHEYDFYKGNESPRTSFRRVHTIITESDVNRSSSDPIQIFNISEALVNHADFSRWMAIRPSVFTSEAMIYSRGDPRFFELKTLNASYKVPVYHLEVNDNIAEQDYSMWVWIKCKNDAMSYLRSLGVTEECLDDLQDGYQDDSSSQKKHIVPVALLDYYIGKNFVKHDLNETVMPIGGEDNFNVIVKPLNLDDVLPGSATGDSVIRPSLTIELSVYFDLVPERATEDKADPFQDEIKAFQKYTHWCINHECDKKCCITLQQMTYNTHKV